MVESSYRRRRRIADREVSEIIDPAARVTCRGAWLHEGLCDAVDRERHGIGSDLDIGLSEDDQQVALAGVPHIME